MSDADWCLQSDGMPDSRLQGACKYTETISEGLESFPAALITMLEGKNLGKQLVRVSADPLAADLAGGDAVNPEGTGTGRDAASPEGTVTGRDAVSPEGTGMSSDATVIDAPTSALQLLQAFIRTPSVSPDHAPGAPPNKFGIISGTAGLGNEFGELRMAEAVRAHFEALGAEVHWDEVTSGRPGVYGVFRATEGDLAAQKWLGVEVHMDTVGVQTAVDPFGATVDADGKLHGRGACDTKVRACVCVCCVCACVRACVIKREREEREEREDREEREERERANPATVAPAHRGTTSSEKAHPDARPWF